MRSALKPFKRIEPKKGKRRDPDDVEPGEVVFAMTTPCGFWIGEPGDPDFFEGLPDRDYFCRDTEGHEWGMKQKDFEAVFEPEFNEEE